MFVDTKVTRGHGHVMADKLVILHFVLSTLTSTPSPVNFMHNLMYSYLGDALLLKKVVFDLSQDGGDKHIQSMEMLLQRLKGK